MSAELWAVPSLDRCHCTGRAIYGAQHSHGQPKWRAMCVNVFCSASTALFDTPAEAATAWNRRVEG